MFNVLKKFKFDMILWMLYRLLKAKDTYKILDGC